MMSPQEHLEESINYALKTAELNTLKGRMKIIKNEMQCWKKLPLIINVLKLNEKILELLSRKCIRSNKMKESD